MEVSCTVVDYHLSPAIPDKPSDIKSLETVAAILIHISETNDKQMASNGRKSVIQHFKHAADIDSAN
jgi:hypothetical protein